jgi:hypothetical protein
LNILMISERDAGNQSLAVIARAFREKGHVVAIYAVFVSEYVLRMFDEMEKIKCIDDLSNEVINQYDVIFTSALIMEELRAKGVLYQKKYIFTYDYLIHGEAVNGGDFNFAPSLYNTTGPYYSELKYPKMGIGEPRFDNLIKSNVGSNVLLFIDSGHYPYSEKGKEEVANLLLAICRKFPEYELCIAPRYLPNDKIVTHLNTMHLYDVLEKQSKGKLPANLNLTKHHVDLMELINRSKTVLCMYTTAYISALVAQKGLIIIDGLPNEDALEIRHKRYLQIREGMKGSGALVDYKQVLDYLPEGIQAPDSHVQKELTNIHLVAEKIVTVSDHIFRNFIKKGIFPQNINYEYDEFPNNIIARKNAIWETIISDRLENTIKKILLRRVQARVHGNICLDTLLFYVQSLKHNNLLSIEAFGQAYNNFINISAEILINNYKILEEDDIDFGILLESYYIKKRYNCIKKVKERNLGSYYFFRGKVAVEDDEKLLAQQLFLKYLSISHGRAFLKEISDLPQYRAEASIYLVDMYLDQNDYATAKYYLNLYEIYSRKKNARFSSLIARGEAYNLLHEKWENIKGSGNTDLIVDRVRDGSIMIYGAGTITENLVLNTAGLKHKIKVLIDQNSADGERFGFPLISPEQIVNYTDIKTILVTVPHAFEQIRNILMSIRNDLEIISISDLVDLEKDEL